MLLRERLNHLAQHQQLADAVFPFAGLGCERILRAQAVLEDKPRKQNPALKIAENAERSLRAFLREFGMTPSSRERVKPTKPAAEPKEDSPFSFVDEQQ